MPDAFGRPTQEELWMQAILSGKASPTPGGGMASPYVTPEMRQRAGQDFTGREDAIESQRGAAQALRGAQTRPGQGVGPSNIYVQPHWAEGLATGVQRAYGGYLEGKANKKSEGLDKARSDQKAAAIEIADARLQQGRDVTVEAADLANTRRVQAADLANTRDVEAADIKAGAALEKHEDLMAAKAIPITNGETVMTGYATREGWRINRDKVVSFEDWYEYEDPSNAYQSNTVKKERYIYQPKTGETKLIGTMGDTVVTPAEDGTWQPLGFNPADPKKGWMVGTDSATKTRDHVAKVMKTEDTGKLRELTNSSVQMLQTLEKYGMGIDDISDLLGQTGKAGGLIGKISRYVKDINREGGNITAQEVSSTIAQVLNDVIRAQAGMSQTVAEIQRVTEAYGNDLVSHPDVMEWALKRMFGRLDARLTDKRIEFGDQAMATYRRQMGDKGSWLDIDFGAPRISLDSFNKEIEEHLKKAPGSDNVDVVVTEDEPVVTETTTNFPLSTRKSRRGQGASLPKSTAPVVEELDPWEDMSVQDLEERLRLLQKR